MTTEAKGETTTLITEGTQEEDVLRGYYLPRELDDEIQKRTEEINGVKIELLELDKDNVEKIIETLKENQTVLENRSLEDIVSPIAMTLDEWRIDSDYEKKERVMKFLPKLTGHSKQQIEFYSLGTFESIDLGEVSKLLQEMDDNDIGKEIFKEFISFGDVKLKGYASVKEKLRLGLSSLIGEVYEEKQPTLITNVTPSNVTGLLEVGSVLYSALARATTIVKTPSKQPIFGPAFLESLEEKDHELASTIAILNWQGGNPNIEDIVYENSDIVNVVGDNETIDSVMSRIIDMDDVRGTYHGAKIGFGLIGKGYPNSEFSTEELAKLIVIDVVGHEGYACHSPAFGIFVEGDKTRARRFAEELKRQAETIDKLIPQGTFFKSKREDFLIPMLAEANISDKELFISDHTVIEYSPLIEFDPMSRNRTIRIMPFSDISDIVNGLKKFQKTYGNYILQTAGVAISNERLEEISDYLGKIGVTNIRAVGGVNFPKAGETWDGKIPIREFKIDDPVRYISVPRDIDKEIRTNLDRVIRYAN